ncbi:alcohol dehydrogenase-like isoform X1 [Branchiostoma lanceolatum]|uniref:alcohol dehydrogenase-like isoform X1 n=2 Tax=Branchiostoma lanceolatum TaxID=7740 RepID=UPI00345387CA
MARRSAKLVKFNEPFQLVTDDIPSAPPGGAVVKVQYTGLCHSDVDMSKGEKINYSLPLILGHEVSGRVHSLDQLAVNSDIKVGDRVMVYAIRGCGVCSRCKVHKPTFCLNRVRKTIGFTEDGGFSDYLTVADLSLLMRVPETVAMDTACLLPCSGLTSCNAVLSILPTVKEFVKDHGVPEDCAVLLVGAGGLGLWAVQIAREVLPDGIWIVCADRDPEKLAEAKAMGCDEVVLWNEKETKDNLIAATSQACGRVGGAVAAVDFVNTSETFSLIESVLIWGGIHVTVGVFGDTASLPLKSFTVHQHKAVGVLVGTQQQLRELLKLVEDGKVKAPPITHHPLESAWNVLQDLRDGKVKGRAVIEVSEPCE